MKNNRYIITAIIVFTLVAIGGSFIWQGIKTESELKSLIAYNDSIEKANRNLVEYIQFRTDSIDIENKSRLGVSFFIKDKMQTEHYSYDDFGEVYIRHFLRDSWIDSLKNINFELQDTILTYADCNEYDDELWDIYGMTYTREIFGRNISVTLFYNYWKRMQDGEVIPESKRKYEFNNSFDIKFSSREDYDYFLQSLRKHNYIKKISDVYHPSNGEVTYEYITFYDDKDSPTNINIRRCNDPSFRIDDNLTIHVELRFCNG